MIYGPLAAEGEEGMKRLRACMMKMARVVVERCRNLDIKLTIWGGTLLGAARHKGFIPWDDDMDFALLREDYDRFVSDPTPWPDDMVFTEGLTSEFPFLHSKVYLKGTTFIPVHEMDMACGRSRAPYRRNVFVDVFPLDNAPADRSELRPRGLAVDRLKWELACEKWSPSGEADVLEKIHPSDSPDYVYTLTCSDWRRSSAVRRALFDEMGSMPFEGETLPALSGVDEALTSLYGDWRVPQKYSGLHGGVFVDLDADCSEYYPDGVRVSGSRPAPAASDKPPSDTAIIACRKGHPKPEVEPPAGVSALPVYGGAYADRASLALDPGVRRDDDAVVHLSWANPFVNELSSYFWAWQRCNEVIRSDYVVQAHYRRMPAFRREDLVRHPDGFAVCTVNTPCVRRFFMEWHDETGAFTSAFLDIAPFSAAERGKFLAWWSSSWEVPGCNILVLPRKRWAGDYMPFMSRFILPAIAAFGASSKHIVASRQHPDRYDMVRTPGFMLERLTGFWLSRANVEFVPCVNAV